MYPILFKLGPVTIYSYGLLVGIAALIAGLFIIKDSVNYGIPRDEAWNLLLFILICGIIGARALHVLLNFRYYKDAPLEILMLHRGGLAIQGGIIIGIFASMLFLLRKNLPLWKTGDLIMQYLPLGEAIGRVGCFLNGCCYGREGLPTQLFLSAALFIVFILLKQLKKTMRFDGQIFLGYFIIHSPLRFFIDFLRGDLSPVLLGLRASQLVGILLFVIALFMYHMKAKNDGKVRFKGRRI